MPFPRRLADTAAVLVLAALTLPAAAVAAPPAGAPARQIIVARTPHLAKSERGQLRAAAGVRHVRDLRLADTEVVQVSADRFDAALAELNADPGVRYAEPDGLVHAHSTDPAFSVMWALENTGQSVDDHAGTADADIDAPEAWPTSTGAGQTVAVVDSGLLFSHQDVQGAFAVNPGESGGGKESNGLDDDHDGLVDDYRGWDFANDDNDPADADGHGTAITGVVAATKDNELGTVGVAPSAKVLVLQAISDTGTGTEGDVADAFDLAGDLGIGQVNASFGGGGGVPQTLAAAIHAHPQTLYVTSAGNGGTDEVGDDTDDTPSYPCALSEPNVICVGATDSDDARTAFSNFGLHSVDLFAPGLSVVAPDICSTSCYA